MPIYEYRCLDCNAEFSKLVFRQDDKVKCIRCESGNVEKLISKISSYSPGACGPGGCTPPSSGFK